MKNNEINNIEVVEEPFDWSGLDHKAIREGFDWFFSNNQITGFKRDKFGRYVRDEHGKLIAHRTSKKRYLPRVWFNNLHD